MDQDRLLNNRLHARPDTRARRPSRVDKADVVDVRPAFVTAWRRRLAVLSLVVVGAGAGVWWAAWGQPWQLERTVDAGMKELSKRQPEHAVARQSMPDEQRLAVLARLALDRDVFDPPQPALAEAALRLAMRRGSRDAALDLGVLYRDGELGKADTGKALSLLDKVREDTEPAARAGEPSALIVMGRIYAEGLGLHADQARGVEMTLRGAANGTPEQKYRIGTDYFYGVGVFSGRANKDEGLRLIEESASAGSVDAMENAGLILGFRASQREREIDGFDTSPERRKAYEWSAKAAQLGRTSAMGQAGSDAWQLGDFGSAEKWLEAAYRGGVDDSPDVLGMIRVVRSTGPISKSTPGVEMLARAYVKSYSLVPNENERFGNAASAQWEATRGIVAMPSGSKEGHRAALVSLAWIAVLGRLGGDSIVSRDALDKHLRTLTRQARSELIAESRRLADIIYAPPAGSVATNQWAVQSERPIAQTRHAPAPAPSARASQASVDRQVHLFADLLAEPVATNQSARNPESTPQAEPPPQDSSGYLRGEPRASRQGLSSFAIDNTKGAAGAIVRLYREGKMPSAYSFFVKQGESFTGSGIVAGNYVMRYRNLGSGNVYEADKLFDFTEVETAEGTRFSRARITLFGVPDGSMKVLPVAESKF